MLPINHSRDRPTQFEVRDAAPIQRATQNIFSSLLNSFVRDLNSTILSYYNATFISISTLFANTLSERKKQFSTLPKPVQKLANYIHSYITSFFSFSLLSMAFPINLELYDPKIPSEKEPPVLLIHGFLGASNNWIYLKHQLEKSGHKNIFTINLGSPFLSIDEFASKTLKKIEEIKAFTKRDDIILIGHSMGGLIALRCKQLYQDLNIKKIITIGTPLEGTTTALLATKEIRAACDMTPYSSLTLELQANIRQDKKTQYTHIATQMDSIIRPPHSAAAGINKNCKIIQLQSTGHVAYLFSKFVAEILEETIQTKNNI